VSQRSVRLQPHESSSETHTVESVDIAKQCFNLTRVRLKRVDTNRTRSTHEGFNLTRVRLKPVPVLYQEHEAGRFNLTRVRLKPERFFAMLSEMVLQPHESSSETLVAMTVFSDISLLQPHESSSETRRSPEPDRISQGFNLTRVRLKRCHDGPHDAGRRASTSREFV